MLVMFLVDHDKAMDLAGTGTDELEGAEDVKTAREELKVLHEEKHRTEKIRATVKKELEVARTKTRKLEEVGLIYPHGGGGGGGGGGWVLSFFLHT